MANEFAEATTRPWRKEFPLEREGHWWMRFNDGSTDTFHLNEFNSARPENFLDVEAWLGPITPADTEQLFALRAAAEAALKHLNERILGERTTVPHTVIAAQLRAALHPQPEETNDGSLSRNL